MHRNDYVSLEAMAKARIAISLGALLLPLALATPAAAQRAKQAVAIFHVTPDAADNPTCSETQPCTPQGAVMACQAQWKYMCAVFVAPGVYLDPQIDVYHFKFVQFFADVTAVNGTITCNNPGSVVFQSTINNTTLINVQDHATMSVYCARLDSAAGVTGVTAIYTRNHVVADWINATFGAMPGGTHVDLNGFTIGHCISNVTITGGGPLKLSNDKTSYGVMACAVH